MTKDEAIRILENAPWFKWACQATVISKEVERVREAEQMAIDTLKAQLTEKDTTSDCISRQEAIRIASGYCHFTNVAKELEKLPSVQPEYEPVKTEDFAKTMSENTLYSFMAWHGEALDLMERQGFVICKKTL